MVYVKKLRMSENKVPKIISGANRERDRAEEMKE
jgi:hypothetical protein